MNNLEEQKAYASAKKRLKEEKVFYVHVGVYITINIASFIFFLTAFEEHFPWLFWINALRPLLWGIGLLCHGLWTFRRDIIWFKNTIYSKQWEDRKIEEIMKDEKF